MDQSLLNNEIFKQMSEEKLAYIQEFISKDKPGSANAALPFLMASLSRARANHIHFTRDEIMLICNLLCQNLNPDDQAKARRIMQLMNVR